MRKILGLLALTLSFGVAAWADASDTGCLHSNGKAAGCSAVAMPEPSVLPELAVGAVALGFFAFRRRKSLPAA